MVSFRAPANYNSNDDSSALLAGQQIRNRGATGTDGTENVTLSLTGGPADFSFADVSLSLGGGTSVTSNHIDISDSIDSDPNTVDQPYVVTVSITDSVGNTASAAYGFDILGNAPTMEWAAAPTLLNAEDDEDGATAGLQARLFNSGGDFMSNGGSVSLWSADGWGHSDSERRGSHGGMSSRFGVKSGQWGCEHS